MRYDRSRLVLVALAGLLPATGAAAENAATISFVSCPVYRDVDRGPKSGCWLATDPASGIRYDIGAGRSKPQWGREVLVEGVVSDTEDRCGGVVMKPVRIAVLPGACNKHMLPAEGFSGRAFELPAEVMQQIWEPRKEPEAPYSPREFVIYFGFDSSFPLYQYSEIILEKAALYARASQPASITVTGFAATEPLEVSGRALVERADIGRERAEKVALALERLGVPGEKIDLQTRTNPEPWPGGDEGLVEPSRRRVVIELDF